MMRVLTESYFPTDFNLLLQEKDWIVFLKYYSFVAVTELTCCCYGTNLLLYEKNCIALFEILYYMLLYPDLLFLSPLTFLLILTLPSTGEQIR